MLPFVQACANLRIGMRPGQRKTERASKIARRHHRAAKLLPTAAAGREKPRGHRESAAKESRLNQQGNYGVSLRNWLVEFISLLLPRRAVVGFLEGGGKINTRGRVSHRG